MKTAILAGGLAFLLSTVFTALLIPFLKKQHIRQETSEYVPEHQKKSGTPTMGGLAFVLAIFLASLPFLKWNPECFPVLLLTLGFGVVGFTDDFMKLRHGKNEGLSARQKLLGQLILTVIFLIYRMTQVENPTLIYLPFSGREVEMGWLYIPFLLFVVLGTDNGVNLTDGIDGLCSSVTLIVAVFFVILSESYGYGLHSVCAAVAGALLGFLLFNTNPAKVFMGDTGSLALGGFVSAAALTLRQPLIILLVGIVYLCETLSVMIQRTYFKLTHGKRIFKKTPIHHTFELEGWSEARIVIVFTAVTVFFCGVAYLGI